MNINALLKNYFTSKEHHERKSNRFWATDLYEILTGRIKPKDFLKEKTFDLIACRNMFEGEIREYAFKQLLDASKIKYDYQVKKEKKFKEGFELVAVSDFLFPDYILECKSPREFSGIKDYHRPQLECQYRLFNKPVYVGYVKSYMESQFFKYNPSDQLWKLILEKLSNFYKNLNHN